MPVAPKQARELPSVGLTRPKEIERHARIVDVADKIFQRDGEAMQMKDIARDANVSLATLYNHFPSKDHILAGIAWMRSERDLRRFDSYEPSGATAGERAAEVLLHEIAATQNNPDLAAALYRVRAAPTRSTSVYIEGVRAQLEHAVTAVIENGGGTLAEEQRVMLPLVMGAAGDAVTRWISGSLSVKEAREQIRVACRILDLPPRTLRTLLQDASG